MHSNNVVFPAPLGPIRPSTSPARIDRETSDKATSLPYDLVRCSTVTRDAIAAVAVRRDTISNASLGLRCGYYQPP